MKRITKEFPGVIANDHIDFDVKSGEIHALLGENGAGKTTLMNILYGLYQADEGEVYIAGKRVEINSPRDALRRGIGMVHQLFRQVHRHSVVENVALSASTKQILPVKEIREDFQKLAKEFGWKIDLDAKIWQLSAAERQRLEILKVIFQGVKILILDEPTSVLTPQGKEELFVHLKRMKEEGYAIIYITHKLDEVLEISDRVTVLRKGKKVKTLSTAKTTKKALARRMVGREVLFRLEKEPLERGDVVLKAENLIIRGDRGEIAVDGVSFKIYENEILGLAGVGGSGQRELIEALAGLRKVEDGSFKVFGEDLTNALPREIIEREISYIPENRDERGLIPSMSVKENLMLKDYWKRPYCKKFLLNMEYIRQDVEEKVSKYNVVTPNIETPAELLSGGNLQRLMLARETSGAPNLLIAAYPTHGLDVGSVEDIRKLLLEQRKEGSAIFLISEDLDEIMMLSNRTAVIYEGRLMGIVDVDEVSKEDLGLMMTGTPKEEVL
ncbi:hypothetical protein AKJ35_00750 [candidate division MSBL1 archaeon SCGC-AAA833F18]|uniref:ABC transporter domain-containing protein n=3 Tax=candidate division MSBL1 TaxID=215777 RepID=A0A133V1B0_9EURY|nr:hypothetical protein AKJ42_01305 [candidate division MSBL1 archaeon SCGC-AAA261C02]KXB03925.1 hypothetical protein AKJ47_01490 [candidate division MSBL1 archaeon SCGC-AAA261G05]KXB09472.1 hypothetical protein AKJ35_00750 [candidate division MSBL1 archaeon SCGC-AAA833F18]